LKDKTGQQKERKLELLQKGSDRRMIRFLSPADQKGIGFLSLPDDVMYLYLPAFKKTRRIASHIKNTKFAGTDYTYEDLEAKRYSDQWIPTLQKNDNDAYVLELTLKPNAKSDYSKMVMTVRKDNYYVSRLEMADKTGKLVKILTRDKIEQIGAYWIAKESLMEDLKEQHKTKMNVQDVLLDQSLGDNKFSERYLSE
jgi:outer membrane lipoprotein-sorting protein